MFDSNINKLRLDQNIRRYFYLSKVVLKCIVSKTILSSCKKEEKYVSIVKIEEKGFKIIKKSFFLNEK